MLVGNVDQLRSPMEHSSDGCRMPVTIQLFASGFQVVMKV
jgi:hypothetical protein